MLEMKTYFNVHQMVDLVSWSDHGQPIMVKKITEMMVDHGQTMIDHGQVVRLSKGILTPMRLMTMFQQPYSVFDQPFQGFWKNFK